MSAVDQHDTVHHDTVRHDSVRHDSVRHDDIPQDAVHQVQQLLNDLGQVLQRPPHQRAHFASRTLTRHQRIDACHLTSYQLEVQEIVRAALVALATGEPIRATSIHQWAVSVVESHTAGAHDRTTRSEGDPPVPVTGPDDRHDHDVPADRAESPTPDASPGHPRVATADGYSGAGADPTAPRPAVERPPAPDRPSRTSAATTPRPAVPVCGPPAYEFLRATTGRSARGTVPPEQWEPPAEHTPRPPTVFAPTGTTPPERSGTDRPADDGTDLDDLTHVDDLTIPAGPERRGRTSGRRTHSVLWTVLGGLLAMVAGATAVAVIDSTLNRAGTPPAITDADPAGPSTTLVPNPDGTVTGNAGCGGTTC
ncbi:MAG: hypothetical protein ACK5PP_01185 [Acidimicrobiales bacterium]